MTVIEAKNLTKRHGKKLAVDAVDLSVEPGQIVGLLGPNGAGKSSLLNAVLGLTPFEGSLQVLGLNPWTQRDQLMQQVCFVSDVAVLPRWLKVNQLLAYVGGVHPRFSAAKANTFLTNSGIEPKAPIKSLSKGMLAQLHLAVVLAIDAKLLVLDEPTLGLDALVRKQFYDRLLGEYADEHRSIVIASHQLDELAHVLSHVVLLKQGRVVLQAPCADVFERFVQVQVRPDALVQARALGPIHESTGLGGLQMTFDLHQGTQRDQLLAIGELRIPSLEDVFVAVMSPPRPSFDRKAGEAKV